MNPENAQRIALLRPLLIFMVIAVHLPGNRYRPDTHESIPGLESLPNVLLSGTLGMVAVPTLSVIAGYLAYHSLQRYPYATFIKRKVRHLLLPMLLWNLLLGMLLAYGQYHGVNPRGDLTLYPPNPEHWLAGLFGIGKLPANAPLYFLRELFIACLLMPLWLWAAKRPWRSFVLLGGLWWLAVNQLGAPFIFRADIYFFFAAGVVLAQHLTLAQVERRTVSMRTPLVLGGLGACLLMALYASITRAEHYLVLLKALMLIGPLLFWHIGGLIQHLGWAAPLKRLLLVISPATFTIFLGHMFVIQLLWHGVLEQNYMAFYVQHYLVVWAGLVATIYVSLYAVWWLTQRTRQRLKAR